MLGHDQGHMKRLLVLTLFLTPLGCGDDSSDEGLPNGKPCQADADCASDFCLLDDVNGNRICATPRGSNEATPRETDTETDGRDNEGSSTGG